MQVRGRPGFVVLVLCGWFPLAGCSKADGDGTGSSRARAGPDAKLAPELRTFAQRKIFFGHQSVGRNIIEGLRQLAAREGVPLEIGDEDEGAAGPAIFTHGAVARNGDPVLKLQSFSGALASGPPAGVDTALVKFCYVDFSSETDVAALFTRYQDTVAALKARYPRTTFVHVTAPLTAVPGGPKEFLKRLLGRPPAGAAENGRREDYNALVRRAYQGREPLFDLAAVESTRPDGSRVTVDLDGRAVPVLFPAYTYDDGHLNGEGQLRAARELVSVIAAIPPRGDPAGAAEQE